mmetsp:Transcript_2127/g.3183  ORF Transcript_2127/g.3183 Transcript_2127/m.3183 type:complete len:122 (+) Transcript_2127:215-580(+)
MEPLSQAKSWVGSFLSPCSVSKDKELSADCLQVICTEGNPISNLYVYRTTHRAAFRVSFLPRLSPFSLLARLPHDPHCSHSHSHLQHIYPFSCCGRCCNSAVIGNKARGIGARNRLNTAFR